MFQLLKELTQTFAPSGSESALYELIKREITPYVDDIQIDPLGNLIAHKAGIGEKVMFAAHMDEIGVIATYILENGFIKFSNLGGVSPHYALHQRVQFLNGTIGVVSYDNKEADTLKNLKLSDLYIDIGTKNREETEKMVQVGDAAGFVGDFSICGERLVSKAMDDRVGCFVLIEAIKQVKNPKNDLYYVFTVSEELGLRGAKTAAFSIQPDYAVAMDVTRTGDTLGKLKMAVSLGEGVAVKIKDSSILVHPYIKDFMIATCKSHDIPYQLEVLESGGTDSGAIHISNGGVPTGCISIPTRYIHSPCEMVDGNDVQNAIKLTLAMIEKGFGME